MSESYQHPNRNLIPKDILDVIHDQNMEMKLILIRKESDILGLLCLGDGVTIYRTPLLNMLVQENIFHYMYYNFLIDRVTYKTVIKIWNLYK